MPQWLLDRFSEAGESPALVVQDRIRSYGWVLRAVAEAEEELESRGVSPSSVVSLEADYSPWACAFLLAMIRRGAVVVPLTSGAEADRERLLSIAQVEARVRISEEGEREYPSGRTQADHPLTRSLLDRGEAGLVLFTSGSTGEPKGALHSFPRLLRKFVTRRRSLSTLTFLLLDHIGGINTLFHILSNTGTAVTVWERSPDGICAAIEKHKVELLPTTPTFLNLLLLSEALSRYDLSSLKQITYGTEPMPEATLRRLHTLLPHVRLSQTYGLSELGILPARSKASDSLWVRLKGDGFETKVENGTLWIRAESAMLGYLNAPNPFDAEGWFNTEDEVITDGEYFQIRGRRSEIINVGGEKVYPADVEGILLQMDNVRDVVVRGYSNPITGQGVAADFNLERPEDRDALRRRIREHCRDRLAPFKVPTRVEITERRQYSDRFKKERLARSKEQAG